MAPDAIANKVEVMHTAAVIPAIKHTVKNIPLMTLFINSLGTGPKFVVVRT